MTGRIPWVESRAPRPAVEMRKWLSISSLLFLSFCFPFLHRSMKRPTRESCLFTRSAQVMKKTLKMKAGRKGDEENPRSHPEICKGGFLPPSPGVLHNVDARNSPRIRISGAKIQI